MVVCQDNSREEPSTPVQGETSCPGASVVSGGSHRGSLKPLTGLAQEPAAPLMQTSDPHGQV